MITEISGDTGKMWVFKERKISKWGRKPDFRELKKRKQMIRFCF